MSSSAPKQPITRTRRCCYIALAGFFFHLGVLGIALPGLPTTPFLLLTSYFLLRSWPRMNERLMQSRLFGGVLCDWQHHGGVQRHVKIKAIVLVALMVCGSLWLIDDSSLARGLIACGALTGLLVINRLPEVARD